MRMLMDVGSMNQRQSDQKEAEESATDKPEQSFVTCIHLAKIADLLRTITVTWSKSLINHTLFIIVENPSEDNHYTCKIDLKTWQFWGKKGLKSFKVDQVRVDVYWDFRAAKFSSSPEPVSDYYVALATGGEVVILLGDQKNEAFKRTKSRPPLVDAALVHKKESGYAKRCFCTRTMLGQGKREHNIIIETDLCGPTEPEMWISVDGIESVRVMNLNWRFRGNETVMVDNVPVDVFWDVHDWMFNDSTNDASGPGVFIFKQGSNAKEEEEEEDNSLSNGQMFDQTSCDDSQPMASEFCHVFYAWKTE